MDTAGDARAGGTTRTPGGTGRTGGGGATGTTSPGSPGSTAEYDAFGPWIDPVRTEEELPRLFRAHGVDLASARLVLKVPREISRRDATPDMDLYDHLLVVGPETFTVLSRHGATVVATDLRYDEIAAVRTSVNLLDGRLTVLTRSGEVLAVRFSGSSSAAVTALVDLLRLSAWPAPAVSPDGSVPGGGGQHVAPGVADGRPLDRRALGEREIGLLTEYRDALVGHPDVRTLAAHPRMVVRPARGGPAALTHLLRPMTLHALVVCSDGTELQVFGRADPLVRGRTPDHSWSRLVLPVAGITAVTSRPDPRYAGVGTVTIAVGAASLHLPVPAGSPTEQALLAAAEGLGAREVITPGE
ncbi:MAG TPA: hypothetical protein VGC57_06810 [Cellulomonas sp.]